VSAHELQPNPKNWRTHPTAQQDALRGVLAEVGIAGAVLARETAEGGLMLIDGHLRTDVMHDQEIPVLVLDVDEAEADKLLATIDPLAAMAEADAGKLDELLREIDTGSEALQEMLAKLAEEEGIAPPDFDPAGIEDQSRLDEKAKITCPECGHEFTP
jgi:ParB-like chromosome segregation protein Spo0J